MEKHICRKHNIFKHQRNSSQRIALLKDNQLLLCGYDKTLTKRNLGRKGLFQFTAPEGIQSIMVGRPSKHIGMAAGAGSWLITVSSAHRKPRKKTESGARL